MKDFLHAIIGLCRALAVRHRTCWCAHMCVYNFVLPRPQVGGNPSPVNTQILLARTKNHDQIAMHRQNGKTNQFLPMVWAIAKASSCVMHTMLCFFIILASLELKSGLRKSLLVPHNTIGVFGQCLRSSGTHLSLTFSKDVREMIEKHSRKTSDSC